MKILSSSKVLRKSVFVTFFNEAGEVVEYFDYIYTRTGGNGWLRDRMANAVAYRVSRGGPVLSLS